MPVEMCEYYVRNNFTPRYYFDFHKDSLVRYAVSGYDPEIFRILSENFFDTKTYDIKDIMTAAIILFKKEKYEMLDILIEGLEKADINRNSIHSRDERFEKMDAGIVLYRLFDGEKPEMMYEPKFYNSLYFAMITGDMEKAKESLESAAEIGIIFCNNVPHMASAVFFRDTEFLRLLFENKGHLTPEIIADICDDPDAVKYLCENFSGYIFIDSEKFNYDGWENSPMSAAEFVQHTVMPDRMLEFAYSYYHRNGTERFNMLFKDIPKILRIREHDIVLYHDMIFKGENGLINTESIFESSLVLVVESGVNLRDFCYGRLKVEDFVYDFSSASSTCMFGWNVFSMRRFLLEEKVVLNAACLSPGLQMFLDYNDGAITGILIAREFINNWNIDKVKEYLALRNWNNALDTIAASEIPHLDLPF